MLTIMLLLLSFSSVSCVLNQLSFSGGGSFGAVEIGIIKNLMERQIINFDLYTGISAGALNAGFLSYYSNINEGITRAENIYKTINNRMVYKLLPPTLNDNWFKTQETLEKLNKSNIIVSILYYYSII